MRTRSGAGSVLRIATTSALLAILAACGGGGGGSGASTTALSTTVIDGLIENALVCLDKNANGACDAGEPQGRTNAQGKVTIDVPNADIGQHTLLAIVGTDAIDAVHGKVLTPFALAAPADQTAVVTPITTLVQQLKSDTGSSTAEAAASVQSLTGLTVSVFVDYSQGAAPTSGTDPGTLARMLVVTAQEQFKEIAAAEGNKAADGQTIKRADLDKAIRKKLLERMPALLTAINTPEVRSAASVIEKDDALTDAAKKLAADSSALTVAALPTIVAINNQIASPPPLTAYVPGAGFSVANLNYTDAANYSARFFTSTLAQDTPDANNWRKYVERRLRAVAGHLAAWGHYSDPWRQADLNWNGSAWVPCPINFENMSNVRDAQGNSQYQYCDNLETGKSSQASFDIAGKTMKEVYDSVIAAGFTNFLISNPASALGSTIFPAGSRVGYSTNTSLTNAIAYNAAGKENPTGTSNAVANFSPAITAGGIASNQPPGTLCNSSEGNGTLTPNLEVMISAFTGNPCNFGTGGSFVYNGQTISNTDGLNEQWGPQSLSMGTLGTAPTNSGTAPGFFTGNTVFRVAFKGTGTNPTVYLQCKQRFSDGSTRNCVQIGTGSYTIATLGDARVMTFNNLPPQLAPLTFNRVYVERGGAIYYGFQNKPGVFQLARFNTQAGAALLSQLGLPPIDVNTPLALTAGSYQGTYDARDATKVFSATTGGIITIKGDGTATCQYAGESAHSCTVTITNPATGAFTVSDNGSLLTGTLNQATGFGSGTIDDPSATPPTGDFVIFRR